MRGFTQECDGTVDTDISLIHVCGCLPLSGTVVKQVGIYEVIKTDIKSNSNEFVNVQKQVREYMVGNKKYIVTVSRKTSDPEIVMKKLKQIVINHSDIEC